jgi:hypothetical protein
MALTSPGVQVTVIDESNYIPAATNTVPYILIATAQNKVSGAGTGVAAGTLAVNANRIYTITSQRDLAATFGVPFFYKTTAGTPINGYELNEYGLMAAYSCLGISNRAYVQRADIDLAELTATLVRPTGSPDAGTYWLDTDDSLYGIFQWNETTGAFTNQVPLVLTSATQIEASPSTLPLQSVGTIGDYAINALNANNPVYFKNTSNEWVLVGSDAWKLSWATVQGTAAPTTLTANSVFTVNNTPITVAASPNNTVSVVVSSINSANIVGVTAVNEDGRLTIYADSTATSDGSTANGGIVTILNVTGTALTQLGITEGSYYAPGFLQSPNYQVPRWRTTDDEPKPTGSVWNKTTSVNQGTNLVVKKYSGTLGVFVTQSCPLYANDETANKTLDPTGGGKNIPVGTTYAQYDVYGDNTFTFELLERIESGAMNSTGETVDPVFINNTTFTLQASAPNSTALTTAVTVTLLGTTPADFIAAVSGANVPYVGASLNATGQIVMTHSAGGVIVVEDQTGTPIATAGLDQATNARAAAAGGYILSNWVQLDYTASISEPDQDPANGRLWYYSTTSEADIMINGNNGWQGYQNVNNDVRGYNLTLTNAKGPQYATTAPTTQNDTAQSPLVYGDLWIDTSDLENYPLLYRWEIVDGQDQWVKVNNADQTTENGVLFADARWATNGSTDPITGAIPTITSLLTSNYLDLDAPDPTLYPTGILLFNTRRSGFNVKRFAVNYFNATSYPDETLPAVTNAWVTASGNRNDGSAYMGRLAQRALIVAALKSGIDTSTQAREEQIDFQLIACPQYPELATNMVALNNERNNTGFVLVDTPLRLSPEGTNILTWSTDNNGEGLPTGDGLSIGNQYMATFYPSCQTTDLSGSAIVQPATHMMLRTFIRNDEVAFPWLAPAGTRRGLVDNADRIGYIDSATGEFIQIGVRQGLRDELYTDNINPITVVPGVGITNFGNKTFTSISSALNRINVARLIAFMRGRLEQIGKQFLFEPNDQITRDEIANSVESLMIDLIAKRGIYDYLVVCDLSNNTPATIDRNELYVDIAIEPVKAVEFIYIPLRIKNTGEIAAGSVASAQAAA